MDLRDGLRQPADPALTAGERTGNAEDPEHERETHLRIEGPAVRDLQGGFLENWTEGTSSLLSASHFPDIDACEDGIPVQVARTVSTGGTRGLEEMLWAAPTRGCSNPQCGSSSTSKPKCTPR